MRNIDLDEASLIAASSGEAECVQSENIVDWSWASFSSAPSPAESSPQTVPVRQSRPASERYVTNRTLGQGGMGEVRLCRDLVIGRKVAIKALLPMHTHNAAMHARFLHEAQVQGQLEHPGIPPVYDMGIGADGIPFFVMKRVKGLTLAEILAGLRSGNTSFKERFSHQQLLVAFASVSMTLDFAHSRGVLHRDLKPANIILGDFGEVYLLDWGVAKLATDPALEAFRAHSGVVMSDQQPETEVGSLVGTPAYMAPEQLWPNSCQPDKRADIYSLGAILFEILTLIRLRPNLPMQELFRYICQGTVVLPSACAPDRCVPPELDAICMRATQPRPEDRYATARELHDAVQSYLTGDRNLQLRRESLVKHMGEAKAAIGEAFGAGSGATSARRNTLRALGQVLMLDPDHGEAQTLLGQLLFKPPAQVPKTVAEALTQNKRKRDVLQLRLNEWIGYSVIGMLVIFHVMGVRNWLLFGAMAAVLPPMVLANRRLARHANPSGWLRCFVIGCQFVLLGIMCCVFGPLLFATGPMVIYASIHALSSDRRYRYGVIAAILTLLLGMILLGRLGLIAPSYHFVNGSMVILPNFVTLSAWSSLIMLTLLTIGLIAFAATVLGKVSETLDGSEKKALLDSWHFLQFLPDSASADKEPGRPKQSPNRPAEASSLRLPQAVFASSVP